MSRLVLGDAERYLDIRIFCFVSFLQFYFPSQSIHNITYSVLISSFCIFTSPSLSLFFLIQLNKLVLDVSDNFLCIAIFFNVYFWERERQSASGGGAERQVGTQNLKQALGTELSAQSPTWVLKPRTARSWPKPKSNT